MVRHHGQYEREEDGAMHVNIILPALKERFQIQRDKEFTKEDSLNCFYLGSFKYEIWILSRWGWRIEVLSCNPGTFRWNLRFTKTDELRDDPCTWKEFIYHVGRARDQYSVAVAGLVAGGKERKGRQTIFFTPLDPVNSDVSEAEFITDFQQRKLHDQIHWRPEHDAVYWVHLRSAQNACLEFWQSGSNAILTYLSVPKECVVKVVSESGKREMFARQLTHASGRNKK